MIILEVHASERFSYNDITAAIARGFTHLRFASGKTVRLVDILPFFDEWWT